jgi:hypothetical protein
MIMKKYILLAIALFLTANNGMAQTVDGTIGQLNWSVSMENSTLAISGEGDMQDFGLGSFQAGEISISTTGAPWGQYRIEKVIIEDGVTAIGKNAFYQYSLRTVDIPASVSSIGPSAFGFTNPSAVIVHWTVPVAITEWVQNPLHPSVGSYQHFVFGPTETMNLKEITLIVPQGLSSIYKSTNGWKDFNIVEEGTGIPSIPADDSPIVSTQYYDLLGKPVAQLQKGSIYVVKEIRQSGKTSVRKVQK